jgi:hypothetical protein
MASAPIRDPLGEHLLTPQNAAFVQAGGQPISWVVLSCELQRDWAREERVADVVEIVLTERLLQT